MQWTVFTALLVMWLLGWSFRLGGPFIHLVLALALLLLGSMLLSPRRTVQTANCPGSKGQPK